MKRVLILGGTGAMGVHLVKLLSMKNMNILVTSRSVNESKGNVNYIKGNAKELSFIEPIIKQKWDVIIDFMVYTTEMFRERYDLFLRNSSQYIFLSSARVYADSKNLINEESPRLLDVSEDHSFLKTDEYSLSKARQEDILIESGLTNWTIVRPYITYSNMRLQLGVLEKESWLYRAVKGRTIVFSKDIYPKFTTLTFGLDVSKTISNLVANSKSYGQAFHITVNESMTWEDILNLYCNVIEEKLGFRPKVLLQDNKDFFKHHFGKYQVLKDRVYNRKFDNLKISKFTDHESFISMEKGLHKCLNEFLDSPNFKQINWKAEALRDIETSEFTPLKEIKGIKQKIKYLLFRFKILKI